MNNISHMRYMTTLDASRKWGVSQRRVALLCANARIKGAIKIGKTWLIPEDSTKPLDERVHNGMVDNGDSHFSEFVSEAAPSYHRYPIYVNREIASAAMEVCEENGESLEDLLMRFMQNLIESKGNLRIGLGKGFVGDTDDIDFCNDEVSDCFGQWHEDSN